MPESISDSTNEGAATGLSQLIARILAQLSLSAWLPAAALVLLTAVVTRMADVLDAYQAAARSGKAPAQPSFLEWIVQAVEKLGNLSPTDLVLMFVAVVVLTMLTQAFAFESIRLLEGYWSSWFVIEWVAASFCWYFRQRLRVVRWRERRLVTRAWGCVEANLRDQLNAGDLQGWRPAMIDQLRAEILLVGPSQKLTPVEIGILDDYRWREDAPGNLMRRLRNIDKRLDDYPSPSNVQPTRLGNVLRHYEEETGRTSVESLVDEVYDRLPFSLQVTHDDQRGRLDLYCSMTFVWFFVAGLGALLFGWDPNALYTGVFVATCLVAALVTYRAAVASARYYGNLLILIARYQPTPTTPVPKPWWRRLRWVAPVAQ